MSLSATLLMIPDWQALLVILAALVGPSIIGFVIVHRLVPVSVRRAHNDVAGFVFSVVGVMYGVLLAFVVIVVWEQYSESRINARHESSAALSLQQAMGAYAESSHSPDLRPALLSYLHEIVDGEFPAMAAQRRLPPVSQALEAIWQGVQGLSPTSLRQQVLYGELIGRLNELERLRAERLGDAHEQLPHVIWLALIVGAVLTIGFSFFLGTENVRAHGVMTAVLGALVGVIFYVIVQLDYPLLSR